MKKRVMVIGITMVMLLAGNLARSEVCEIVNPSFEDDGRIDDIVIQEPNGWSVDIPGGKFTGFIYTTWATDGFYSLGLYLDKRVQYFAGDMATVSQQMDLSAVSQITFDVKLDTASGTWDPNVCSAVVLIDDDVVWESNSVGSDARGEYRNQVYVVEDEYRTQEPHTLSLGMRMNADAYFWMQWMYKTHWDMVDCNLFCGGGGLLKGDIDCSCCVDANDLKLLAGLWLSDEIDPGDKANLFHGDDDLTSSGGIISFLDFAIYAAGWDGDMTGLRDIAMNWLGPVDLDYEYNLFGGDDVFPSGFINFFDFAVIADTWLDCSYVPEP